MSVANIQGNFFRGYTHPLGVFRFLEVTDPARARDWLTRLLPMVTTEEPWATKPTATLNLMFTWRGLDALGLPEAILTAFPEEFQQGMAMRAKLLGDTGKDAPEHWTEDFGTGRIHIVASVYALDEAALRERFEQLDGVAAQTGGVEIICQQTANRLVREGPDGRKHYPEHFGYTDGLGQPGFKGVPMKSAPGAGSAEADGTWRQLALGEFLLGHENEDGEIASSGLPEAVLRDGTYVVYRKLQQDVAGFRRFLREQGARYHGGEELLAAKIVGRWRDGTPLALSPHTSSPEIAWDDRRNNDFRYADDPNGFRCPIGAHIRRANPRDALPFGASMVNSHRLIRRGIPYGPAFPEGQLEDDGVERGFLFIAYQTNLARQFEFVQALWLNDGNKFRIGDDLDPLVGQGAGSGKMTVPGYPPHFVSPLPSFLKTRGGEYLLRPGVTGLQYLAEGSYAQAAAPLARDLYKPAAAPATKEAPVAAPPAKPEPPAAPQPKQLSIGGFKFSLDLDLDMHSIGQAIQKSVQDFGLQHPHLSQAQFGLLRSFQPILVLGNMAVVSLNEDVRTVLNDGARFEPAYMPVMEQLAGPGTLGMGPTPEYDRDTAALREVVRQEDLPRIAQFVDDLIAKLMGPLKTGGRLDLVQDFCNLIPIRVLADYFGTPGLSEAIQLDWSHKLFEEIFGNFADNVADITPEGRAVAAQWRDYIDGLIQERRSAIQAGQSTHDDLLDRLIRQQSGSGPSLTDERIRANLIYMTVGFIPQVSKVAILAMDELLNRPRELGAAQEAAQAGDLDRVTAYVWEALRFNAETPGLFRRCVNDTVLAPGTDRETPLKAGTIVLAATQSAAFDDAAVKDPEAFRTDRPWSTYLYFGSGQHTCLGEYVSRTQVPRIAMALLRLPRLRRAHGAQGELSWSGIWPKSLVVEFDRGAY
jgi:Dyp-type peroxidase family